MHTKGDASEVASTEWYGMRSRAR